MRRVLQPVRFRASDDAGFAYVAEVGGELWRIRINEFPEHASLYTLLVNDNPAEELMEWPDAWVRPEDPVEQAEYAREIEHYARTKNIQPSSAVSSGVEVPSVYCTEPEDSFTPGVTCPSDRLALILRRPEESDDWSVKAETIYRCGVCGGLYKRVYSAVRQDRHHDGEADWSTTTNRYFKVGESQHGIRPFTMAEARSLNPSASRSD
jgi:hypothetical protein